MNEITVVAHIHAKQGHHALVGKELRKMIEPTRAERGCRRYDLHRDIRDPSHFVFYETWDSEEAHRTHIDSAHVSAFVMACRGKIAEATIYHLDPIE